MTFLDFPMLLGLTLVMAPVLIHLLNRSKAKPVAWGAMRFLTASVKTRRRRLLVEEMLLLSLRCLAVAAVVMAMARPFLPSQPAVPWPLALPLLAVAAVCVGAAAVLWNSLRLRRRLVVASVALAVVAITVAVAERWMQRRSWLSGNGDRDIVLVIDGSDSMRVSVDGRPNFERAREEASRIIAACGPGDALGLILAGPAPCPLVKAPVSKHKDVLEMLNHKDFRPTGGSFGALEALNAAAAMLGEGRNPIKRVVVFTDQQGIGWDIQSQARWSYLAGNLNGSALPPKIIVRRLSFPSTYRNAAVADIAFPHGSPGVGQAVRIEAKVVNGGDAPIQPAAISLSVDGEAATRETFLKELPPGGSETITFEHRFKKPGRSVVSCGIACDDDLAADNTQTRVLDIVDKLPVLIIDGATSKRSMEGSADFIQLALSPGAAGAQGGTANIGFPAQPETMTVAAAAQADLDKYRVVVLANPTRIPPRLGERLLAKVKSGGGLLIALGSRAEPSILNTFRSPSGSKFLPAEIGDRRTCAGEPARLAVKTFTHPALRFAAAARSDASLALIRSYWRLTVDKADTSTAVGGFLDNGDPFLVERRFGRGLVAMTSFAMDRDDSTLPSLKIFVPTIHELVYQLAAGGCAAGNITPGAEMLFELDDGMAPAPVSAMASSKAEASGTPDVVSVETPSGRPGKAEVLKVGSRRLVRCSDTRWPGLHRIMIGSAANAPKRADGQTLAELPFVVLSDPGESSPRRLSDEELASLRAYVDFFPAAGLDEAITATTGGSPGQEIWKYLMAMGAALLVAETALTRWIAMNRRLHAAMAIDFHGQERHGAFHERPPA